MTIALYVISLAILFAGTLLIMVHPILWVASLVIGLVLFYAAMRDMEFLP